MKDERIDRMSSSNVAATSSIQLAWGNLGTLMHEAERAEIKGRINEQALTYIVCLVEAVNKYLNRVIRDHEDISRDLYELVRKNWYSEYTTYYKTEMSIRNKMRVRIKELLEEQEKRIKNVLPLQRFQDGGAVH